MTHRDQIIMSRIRTVNSFRAFTASPMVGALFASALIFVGSIIVSLRDIFRNTMTHGEWGGRFSYAFNSLIHSRIVVQAIAVLIVLGCGVALFNSLRKVRILFGSTTQRI